MGGKGDIDPFLEKGLSSCSEVPKSGPVRKSKTRTMFVSYN